MIANAKYKYENKEVIAYLKNTIAIMEAENHNRFFTWAMICRKYNLIFQPGQPVWLIRGHLKLPDFVLSSSKGWRRSFENRLVWDRRNKHIHLLKITFDGTHASSKKKRKHAIARFFDAERQEVFGRRLHLTQKELYEIFYAKKT